MSALVKNRYAKNHSADQVVDSLPAFEIDSGNAIHRPLAIGNSWNKLALYCYYAVRGLPATGNIAAPHPVMALGFCAAGKPFNVANAHFAGFVSGDYQWTGGTDANTNPPNQNFYFNAGGQWCKKKENSTLSYITSGASALVVPRYETQWTPVTSWYPYAGWAWGHGQFVATKGTPNWSFSWRWFAWGRWNLPHKSIHLSLEEDYPYNYMDGISIAPSQWYGTGYRMVYGITGSAPINEALYGNLDSVCFYYSRADSTLMIRDIHVVRYA